MFLCGQTHPDDDDPIVVGLDHLLQRDPSLQDILDLEDNSEAERDALGAEWTRKESPA
jgi:hypothetical protein